MPTDSDDAEPALTVAFQLDGNYLESACWCHFDRVSLREYSFSSSLDAGIRPFG